jgi:hypothetical protein
MNAHAAVRSVVRFVVPIVVAAALGPLIAGVAVWLFAVVPDLFGPSGSLVGDGGLLFVYVLFAYLIGGPIALLAGFLLSLWMIRRAPSALAVNAAAVIGTVIWLGVAEGGFPSLVETGGLRQVLFILVLAVLAANVCWFLLRRFAHPALA